MTQKEKQLLLKDLCTRLSYGVKAKSQTSHLEINTIDGYFVDGDGRKMFHLSEPDFWQTVDHFQYYLRPMSSMTEEEIKEFQAFHCVDGLHPYFYQEMCNLQNLENMMDWLNVHHFDYRGLIEKGLVLEAPEDMYML